MQRTQVILDEWQYDGLKALAERRGESMSSVVRDAVAAYLRRPATSAGPALAEIEGIGRDAVASGRGHDGALYPTRKRR